MKPPCGKDCPHRTPGCHSTCEAWGQYEKERNAAYEQRKVLHTVNTYRWDVFAKQLHKKHLKRRK